MTERKQTGSANEYLTFHETGSRLLVAKGLWNSPRDAVTGPLAMAWVSVPDDVLAAVPWLRAGEHIEMATRAFPSLLPIVDRAMRQARGPRLHA